MGKSQSRDDLDELESESIYLIREGYRHFRRCGFLWSIGKDSTVLLWLARKAFLGKIPVPVVHIDTSFKFKEIYGFRDEYREKWELPLAIIRNDAAIDAGMNKAQGTVACCGALKTGALKYAIESLKLDALYLGIRRDEHGIRAKERFFSPRSGDMQWHYRNQPPELWHIFGSREDASHYRLHPLLSWTELDIWRYIEREGIPVTSLYFAKEGKRYRSIGCEPCCHAIASQADTIPKIIEELRTTNRPEREGRSQDKEGTMQKLRSLGYM